MKQKQVRQMIAYCQQRIRQQEQAIYEQYFHASGPQEQAEVMKVFNYLHEVKAGLTLLHWHNGNRNQKSCRHKRAVQLHEQFKQVIAGLYMEFHKKGDEERAALMDKVWDFACDTVVFSTRADGFVDLDELMQGPSTAGGVEDVMHAVTSEPPTNVTPIS